MKPVYLDYSSTTPLAPAVLEAMRPYWTENFGNASSVHRVGQTARYALEQARERLAAGLGANPRELFFTSGGTEANNLAVKGALGIAQERGKTHALISAIEHPSVKEPAFYEAKALGIELEILPVTPQCRVSFDSFEKSLRPETGFVSVMLANHETGTLQSIETFSKITQILNQKMALTR